MGINHFQSLLVRRLAEALHFLGLKVEVCNLSEQIEQNYDWCLITVNPEFTQGSGLVEGAKKPDSITEWKRSALTALGSLRPYCRAVSCCLLNSTDNASYEEIDWLCQATGIDTILDVGFLDQSSSLTPSARSHYHFVLDGLTSWEQEAMKRDQSEEERSIPWVFIGQATIHRVVLVNQLVTRVDPRGFLYMPNLSQDATKTSQHFNQRQYETVLRKCHYHIWHSHHQHFCLESERFRLSLLTGCVPIQVVSEDEEIPSSVPFDYLLLHESEAAEKIQRFNFHEIRRRFRADFLALPSLTEGLAKLLASQSLLPGWQPSLLKSQAA